MHEATILSRTVDDLARVSANSSRQTTLHDYIRFFICKHCIFITFADVHTTLMLHEAVVSG